MLLKVLYYSSRLSSAFLLLLSLNFGAKLIIESSTTFVVPLERSTQVLQLDHVARRCLFSLSKRELHPQFTRRENYSRRDQFISSIRVFL
jgi:hypothetical protein